MSQASVVTSNRVFQLNSQLEGERLHNLSSDEDQVTGKIRGRDEDEEDLDSLRGTGSTVGTTTIIEEEIETITTFEGPPDLLSLTRGDCEDSSSIVSHRSYISGGGSTVSTSTADHHHNNHPQRAHYSHQELNVNNYDLNLSGGVLSVPFPELGVDVVDINYSELLPTEESSSSNQTRLTTDVKSWEDNWLFQKKRKKKQEEEGINSSTVQFALPDLHLVDGPVNMYIPNPSHSESFLEHFPLDDLEELSERGSVVSLTFSTDSEDEKLISESSKPEREIEKSENSNFSGIDLLEEQISSLKLQTSVKNDCKIGTSKEKSHQQPSSGFLSFLKTHDSSDLSFSSTSPLSTLTRSPKTDESQKTEGKLWKNVSPSISLIEPIVLEPPIYVPLHRRITECPRSDPCFVVKPLGASVQPNIIVQFCCRVKGSRPIAVAWYKREKLLENDEIFRIFNSGNEFVMEVKGTRMDQSDTYSCCVYNSCGQQWSDFQLDVKEVQEQPKTPSPPPSHIREASAQKIGQKSAAPIAIITRTWAERTASLSSGAEKEGQVKKENEESENIPRHGNSMTRNTELQVPSSGKSSMEAEITASSIVSMKQGVPSQESVTSDRPIVYSSSPPCTPSVQIQDSSKRGIEDTYSKRPKLGDHENCKGSSGEKISSSIQRTTIVGGVMNQKVDLESGMMINSKSKDLSLYKRDYFVPSSYADDDTASMDTNSMGRNRLDESMNGLEEKVYESSKFFTLRHPAPRQELTTQVSSLSLLDSSKGESGCESASSRKGSSQGEVVDSDENDVERREPKLCKAISPSAFGPSVKKLVRRFSRKESGLERRSTFTSSSSIHDEGRGSGIHVPKRQPGNRRFEVPFVLTTWNKRNRRRTTSCTFPSSSSSSSSDYEHNSCIEIGDSQKISCSPYYRSYLARSISNDNFHIGTQQQSPPSFHVHSITARSMKKEFLDDGKQHYSQPLNRLGSMSLYDIDQVPKSLSPGSGSSDMTATTDSPTNDGYISDDSTVSGTKVKFDSRKTKAVSPIEIHESRKIVTRKVVEKATFWQKGTDNGILSDGSVTEDFPSNVQYISYD